MFSIFCHASWKKVPRDFVNMNYNIMSQNSDAIMRLLSKIFKCHVIKISGAKYKICLIVGIKKNCSVLKNILMVGP